MGIKPLKEIVEQDLISLTNKIQQFHIPGESLNYYYEQAYKENTSLKGESYAKAFGSLFKGKFQESSEYLSGEKQKNEFRIKAEARENEIKADAERIVVIVREKGIEPDELNELKTIVNAKKEEVKKCFSFPKTLEAIERIFHPIALAIDEKLEARSTNSLSFK